MLVNSLYNIVDSYFVAKISEDAMTALSLVYPVQNFINAVAIGFGVGLNAVISFHLGANEKEKADKAASIGFMLCLIHGLILTVVCTAIMPKFLAFYTSSETVQAMGVRYCKIVFAFNIIMSMGLAFEKIFQSVGNMKVSMFALAGGCLVNIILDPIMIFGLFGFPCLGVAGAAYATVFGQCIAAVLGLFLNLHMNKELHISLSRILHPKKEIIGQIYYVGVPSILMMAIGSIMTYCMNLILAAFSTTAAAVFGVYFKLQSFFFMPVFGLNNGLIPILAYNLGARKKQRINEALKFAITLAICIMLCGTLAFELVPEVLLRLFNASDDMLAIGTPALRIIAFHFPLAACGIVMGSIFQAFSQSFYSLIVSLGRQLVVLIPVAWLLSLSGNVNNVWWCFLIAEGVAMVLSTFFFRKVYRKKVAPL